VPWLTKPTALVVPLAVHVVEGVQQRRGGAVVELGGDEHEPIEAGDGGSPVLRVLVLVTAGEGGNGLIEQREVRVFEVDDFVGRRAAAGGLFVDPSGATAAPLRPGRVLPTMIATFKRAMGACLLLVLLRDEEVGGGGGE
jgi:hypothetical protein